MPPSAFAKGPAPAADQDGANIGRWARAAYDVKLRTAMAYNEGWIFHQREAAADPLLLDWIRRKDYWDADIREEMRKQVST